MNLRELDARFVRHVSGGILRWALNTEGVEMADADGVWFQCPKCAQGKPPGEPDGVGFAGAHYVLCWFVGKVADGVSPGPGRWAPSGTGLDDLTLSPSINLDRGDDSDPCRWHGWVRNGEANP